VKAGIAIVGSLGTTVSAKIADMITNAERIGSATKADLYHRAASYLTTEQLAMGQTFNIVGADKASYTLLQVAGELNGKSGVFEYIMNSSGEVTHQLFKIGGIINGIPN